MWEAIRQNTRRSRILIALMGAIFFGLGALSGRMLFGPDGAPYGILAAVGIWGALLTITLLGGENFVLFSAGAREIRKEDAPQLWNVVEEMTIASGLPKMPRVYVQDGFLENAFATGRTPDTARVVVTEGLIRRLNRDELQGVIAHEIGHIKNLDIRFMTIASVMLGSITLLADTLGRILWLGGGRRSRMKGPPQIQMALLALTLLGAIFAPIVARLLYLACSREREYLADASGARFTRYPEGLASALEKISERVGVTRDQSLRALAPMYIVNPLQVAASSSGWFSTHPPTEQRVKILRSMGGNAGWVDYEKAYRKVVSGSCLDSKLLRSEGSVAARAPVAEPEPASAALGRAREVGDLLDRLAQVILIPCACGIRIKVPPDFRKDAISCSRCSRDHAIPKSEPGVVTDVDGQSLYRRRGSGLGILPLLLRQGAAPWPGLPRTSGRVRQVQEEDPDPVLKRVKINGEILKQTQGEENKLSSSRLDLAFKCARV